MKYMQTQRTLKQTKKKCVDCGLYSLEVHYNKRYDKTLCYKCFKSNLIDELDNT